MNYLYKWGSLPPQTPLGLGVFIKKEMGKYRIRRKLASINSDRRRYYNNRRSKASTRKLGNIHINHRKDLQFKGQLTRRRWGNTKAYFGNSGKALKRKRYYTWKQ